MIQQHWGWVSGLADVPVLWDCGAMRAGAAATRHRSHTDAIGLAEVAHAAPLPHSASCFGFGYKAKAFNGSIFMKVI